MRKGFSSIGRGLSPLASGLLLFLFVHAFLVTTTHGYRFGRVTMPEALAGLNATSEEDQSHAPEAGGHSQCLLCRLQRNFVADLQKTSQLIGPPSQETRGCQLPTQILPITRPYSVPAGRAPPLA